MRRRPAARLPLASIVILLAILTPAPGAFASGGAASPAAGGAPAPPESLLTRFERTGGAETSRYEEMAALCRRLAAASPRLAFASFGTSPQGRPLPLLIADARGRFTPEAARRDGSVVLLVQAGIHAGEVCGKDAMLPLLRDLALGTGPAGGRADGAAAAGLPPRVTILLVPILNADGHERFGPYNRVNQDGPAEMGWRTTATNLNLNRDYLKADAPELRAWLALFDRWRPDFFIDLHSTDGADFQYAITYSLELHGNLDAGVTGWLRQDYLPALSRGMEAAGFPLSPYVVFRRAHDPTSGMMDWAAGPRFSQGYVALQNRPGLLIETHMLKPYPVRVAAAREVVRQTIALLQAEADGLIRAVGEADRRAAAGELPRPFPLSFRAGADSTMVDFLGFEFDEEPSDLTGGDWIRFHEDRPRTFRIPRFDHLSPSVTVDPPAAYLVPPEWQDVIARLAAHGLRLRRLAAPCTLQVRSYRLLEPIWATEPYEGRHPLTCRAEPLREARVFPAGTVVVDLRQRAARVAVHALEPQGPDSFLGWGFFDAVFSRAEYVEDYVIERMAREMIARDPSLAARLAKRKAADAAFAADPEAIRDWFYRQTPYYDDRVGIYPVALVDEVGVVDGLPVER